MQNQYANETMRLLSHKTHRLLHTHYTDRSKKKEAV